MTLQSGTIYAEYVFTSFIMLNVYMIGSTSVYSQWNVR
jgi:hypothetical protein